MKRRQYEAILNEEIARKLAPLRASSWTLQVASLSWIVAKADGHADEEQRHAKFRECADDLGRALDELPELEDVPRQLMAEPGLIGLYHTLIEAVRAYHWTGGATGDVLDRAAWLFTVVVYAEMVRRAADDE